MAKSKFNHVKISGITSVVPEKVLNIDDELAFYGGDVKLLERNKKILGLGTRHIVDDRTCLSDLLEAAACDLFTGLNLDKLTIDAVIVASSSHDFHYPPTACVLQGKLGLSEDCSSFDISGLACSAYVHGLWLAHSLVASGAAKKCLVLAGELTSTHSDRRNRNSNMLFGDAGTATLVEATDEDRPSWFITGTRGKDYDKLIAPAGGYYLPIRGDIGDLEVTDQTGNVWRMYDDIMKGMDVFKFTNDVAPKGIAAILEYAGKTIDDVDYFAIHQANKQIVTTVGRWAGLPKTKYSADAFSLYGNCGSAAVTMELVNRLLAQPIGEVCLATFGVGLSWGFAMLDLQSTYVGPVRIYKTPEHAMSREEKIRYWIDYFKGGNG